MRWWSRERAALLGLLRVTWPFLLAAVLMLGLAAANFHVMSAGRAFVDGESLWSKSQKDGLLHLQRYFDTCNPAHFRRFQIETEVPFGDRVARLALEATPPRPELARRGFAQGRIHVDDIGGMIFVFQYLRWVPEIARAVDAWRAADEKLLEINLAAEQLHHALAGGCEGREAHRPLLDHIMAHNDELTPLQVRFSQSLGEANRMVFRLAVASMLAAAVLLGLPGLWLAWRVVRSNLTALQRADEASRAKSEFLANMSHELRTPMNGVLGLAGMLEQSGLDGEQKAAVEEIRRSGATLLALLDDLLDMSRLGAGPMTVEAVPIDSNLVLTQAVDLLRPPAAQAQVALSLHLGEGIPPGVMGDPLRLRQIVGHLVSNAIKFSTGLTRPGAVSVHWQLQAGAQGEPGLQLRVLDNGVGIPAAAQATLFTPFMQADTSTTRRHGGAGLGLFLTHRLVQAMGGLIDVHSPPGQGTAVSVWLPLVLAQTAPDVPQAPAPIAAAAPQAPEDGTDADAQRAPPRRRRAARTDAAAAPTRPERVLVAEDNLANQKVIAFQLRSLGFSADLAADGREALTRLRGQPYDLVITDLHMPEMDGYQLANEIRQHALARPGGRHLPVIALTANAASGEADRCRAVGMDDFLTKPVTLPLLSATIDTWLATTQPRETTS